MLLELLMILMLQLTLWRWVRRTLASLAASTLFPFVRRYGASKLGIGLARMTAARDFRVLRKYTKSRRRLINMIAFIIFLLAFVAFCVSAAGWTVTIFLAGIVLAGAWLCLLGLDYVAAGKSPRKGRLPHMCFPGLPRNMRERLTLRVFWYSTLGFRMAVAANATWVLFALSAIGARPGPERETDVVGIFTVAFLSPLIFGAISRVAGRKQAFDRVIAETCFLLDPAVIPPGSSGRRYRTPIDDPLEFRRNGLGDLANHLSDAGRMLDARQVRGFAPHPVSSLLRAASQYVRQFLSSERSLSAPLPDDLLEVLRSVVMVLMMPGETASREALLQRVKVFDGDGNPAVDLKGRPPGRLAVAASHMSAAIAGIVTQVTGLATIAAIITVLALFALHRLNVIDVLHFMP